MKIEKLRVDGFGHFRNFELALKPGLNVLYGPNEAGKSTLLAFVRAVLFGFEKRTDPERYEDGDGPYGGELQLQTAQGPLLVRRVGGGKKRYEGELLVKDGTGETVSDGRLRESLFNVNKTLFREVFAFSLSELSSLGALVEQKEVSEALFAAGMQGAHRLPEALHVLRQSTSELFTPRGRTSELNKAIAALEELRARIEQLGDRPAAYFAARERLETIDVEAAALHAEIERKTRERERARRLLSVADDLHSLKSARAQLAELPDFSHFPDGALARLETLSAALERARTLRAQQEEALAKCERALKLANDDKLGEDSERKLRSAAEAFNARCAQYQALPGRRDTLSARRRQVVTDLHNLGLKLSAEKLLETDFSTAARASLSAIKDRVVEAERVLASYDERWRTAKAKTSEVEDKVRHLSAESDRLPKTQAPSVRRAQAALARVGVLQEQASGLDQSRREKDAQARALSSQVEPKPLPAVPGWLVPLAAVLMIAACAAAYAFSGVKTFGVALGSSLGIAVLLVLVQRRAAQAHVHALETHANREKFRAQELARLSAEASSLVSRHQAVRAELEAAAAEAGLSPDATATERDARAETLAEELRSVERRIELSRELEGLSAQLATVRKEETNAFADRNVQEAARSRILRELEAACAPRGFPAELTADHALYLFSEAANLKTRLLDLRAEEHGLEADERACQEVVSALSAAAKDQGLPTSPPEAAAAAAIELVDRAREGRRDRTRLASERETLVSQLQQAKTAQQEAESQLGRLFELAGCADGETLRARDAQARSWRELQKEVREKVLKVESGAGLPSPEVEAALAQSGGASELQRQLSSWEAELASASERAKAYEQERGEKRASLSQWENDDTVARLREEEELISARVMDLVHRYAVERVALSLLERSRARFEKDSQPRVVQLASRLFEGLTGGRYVRAFLPAEKPGELWVTGGDGKDRAAFQLSRGTREQLYLAFRLAVIEEFAQTRGPLPVIVDDILVNFDEQRTRNTLTVFARLARDHQFIAFTCHPFLRDLFAEHGAHVVEVKARPKTLFDVKAG